MQRQCHEHDIRGGDDYSLAGIHYTFPICPHPHHRFTSGYLVCFQKKRHQKATQTRPTNCSKLFST